MRISFGYPEAVILFQAINYKSIMCSVGIFFSGEIILTRGIIHRTHREVHGADK